MVKDLLRKLLAVEDTRPLHRATGVGGHRLGGGDCLPKTQDSAKSVRRRIGSDACPVPEG